MKKGLVVIVALLALAVGYWLTGTGPTPAALPDEVSPSALSYIYPDEPGATNPDITQANIADTICNPHWSTRSIRPPVSYTNPIKVKALARYNAEFGTHYEMSEGELDHIISLELGGAPRDPQNLFFEPYLTRVPATATDTDSIVGAHQKDIVENFLHKEVCSGDLSLAQAQTMIRTDWYVVYVDLQHMTAK